MLCADRAENFHSFPIPTDFLCSNSYRFGETIAKLRPHHQSAHHLGSPPSHGLVRRIHPHLSQRYPAVEHLAPQHPTTEQVAYSSRSGQRHLLPATTSVAPDPTLSLFCRRQSSTSLRPSSTSWPGLSRTSSPRHGTMPSLLLLMLPVRPARLAL